MGLARRRRGRPALEAVPLKAHGTLLTNLALPDRVVVRLMRYDWRLPTANN